MKLYLLTPRDGEKKPWEPWYDRAFGFVVRAASEKDARDIASEAAGDEGADAWQDASLSRCEELSADGEAELVMRDFAAA